MALLGSDAELPKKVRRGEMHLSHALNTTRRRDQLKAIERAALPAGGTQRTPRAVDVGSPPGGAASMIGAAVLTFKRRAAVALVSLVIGILCALVPTAAGRRSRCAS